MAALEEAAFHPRGVKGKLATLIGGEVFPEAHYNSGRYVVAGEGLEPPTPGL